LVITPGSELSFDLFVKDFHFNIFDRFSYTQNPINVGSLSGVANYGALENNAGVNAAWDLYKVVLSAGYTHLTWISSSVQFDYLNRASELVYSRAAFWLHPPLVAGLEGTGSLTEYDSSFLHNSVSYSAGVFAEWTLTAKLRVKPRAGYVSYKFDTGGPVGTAGKPSAYYFNVAVDHVLNQYVTLSLEGGREVRLGVYSDFEESYSVRQSATWNMIRGVGLGTQFFYEHGTYPSSVFDSPLGRIIFLPGETFDRFGGSISLSYQLMEKISANLSYRFTLKNSDAPSRDYAQNALIAGLTYRF
jgi:hypothetical protein